jgi:hypothetical protein
MKRLYSDAPSRDCGCARLLAWFAVGRKGLMSFWAGIMFFVSNPTPAATSTGSGIAARYPGDKNIASDPAVILADDFESYTSPSQLTTKWSNAGRLANLRIATETGNYYAGRKALEMKLPISANEVLDNVGKKLSTEQNIIYIRAYTKFDPGFSVTTSSHNGLRVSAHYPGGAGVKAPADGTGFFLFALQNNKVGIGPGELQPGYSNIYAYWPEQRSAYGDHWYPTGMVKPWVSGIGDQGDWLAFPSQYPDFKPIPNWQPVRGKWYCYELMVKANTIGKKDGEVAYWIDGKLAGRFPDLFLRSISTLKIDFVALRLHALHSERVNKKWYDNVVIAKQYIGPMTVASAISASATQFQNFSSRVLIQNGDNVGIAGFVIGGSEPKKLLIRGLGPTLTELGITDVLQNPTLELHDSSGSLIARNDHWKNEQAAAIAATGLAPPNDSESAILATLQPGSYTVVQAGASGGTGVGLLEIYDLDPVATSTLVNMSTRGLVQPGNGALIAGCSVDSGSGANNVLVRALGPSLTALGVKGALPDPILTLYDSNGNVITANDNWKDSQQEAIENTAHQPPDDFEAAIFTTLTTGSYTAVVTGKNGNSGIALLEVYATQ